MRFSRITVLALIAGTFAVSIHSSAQERRPDISGFWRSSIGQTYVIEVQGSRFTWHVEKLGQTATGTIDGSRLTATWQAGRQRQSVTGKVAGVDGAGRAVRIEWSNKIVFFRDQGGEPEEQAERRPPAREGREPAAQELQERRAGAFPDISGDWFSNRGHQLSVHQTGGDFRIVSKTSGAASPGRVAGDPPGWVLSAVLEGQPVEGYLIETDPRGRVNIIEWSNGTLFGRQPFAEGPIPREQPRGGEGREARPQERDAERAAGPDISGTWASSVERTYEIVQSGPKFTWTVKGTNEKASGAIEGDHIVVEWSGGVGSGRAEGRIAGMDESGRVVEIEWSNGVIFTRPAGASGARQVQAVAQPSAKARIAAPKAGFIPAEISTEALRTLMPHLSLKSVFNEWVKVGGPIGGLGYDVRHLADSQRGKRVMFVTDNYSGVNKSVDGGENWFASNSGIKSRTGESQDAIPVFSLTVDPNDPNIVWAGLKDKKGIYKSLDAGATWIDLTANVPIPEPQFVFRGFTIVPGDSKTVFAQGEIPTSQDGLAFNKVKGRIYLTRDGGKSWAVLWEGNDLVRYVIVNPQDPYIVYASCGIFDREAWNSNCKALAGTQNLQQSYEARGGVGVLRSTSGGRTWEVLGRSRGLGDLYVGSLVMHPQNPSILLAGCGNNAASPYSVEGKTHFTGGVFRTENGGDSWVQTVKDDVITSVEFAPSNPDIVYAGGRQNFYVSKDGGKSWQLASGGKMAWGPPGIIAGFPIDILVDPDDPNILFVNNYGGGNVKSTDGGRTWKLASQGYTGAMMFDIAVDPKNSDVVFAAARSGLFQTKNAGASWAGMSSMQVLFPESYSIAVHPTNSDMVIASQEMGGVVARSVDGGKTWVKALQLPAVPGHPLEAYGLKRIVFAPSASHVVYGASCRVNSKLNDYPTAFGVYRSDKNGAPGSWVQVNDPTMAKQAVNDLAVHPKNHNVVYAATAKGGLFKTTDGGKSWSAVGAFPGSDVRSVAVDPVDPRTVYAGLQYGGVFRSPDDGKTWHRMAAGINENQMVWALAVDPVDRTVWAGTQRSGVYRWNSIEQQWVATNKGLSTRAVVDLEISADGRVLYVATWGEGVFRYQKK